MLLPKGVEDQWKAYNASRPTIRDWIVKRYSIETIQDIVNHGISDGFNGMTYYTETNDFHDEYEKEIWDKINTYKEKIGADSILAAIATLNRSRETGSLADFKNLLTWFAVEDECHKILNEREDAA